MMETARAGKRWEKLQEGGILNRGDINSYKCREVS